MFLFITNIIFWSCKATNKILLYISINIISKLFFEIWMDSLDHYQSFIKIWKLQTFKASNYIIVHYWH